MLLICDRCQDEAIPGASRETMVSICNWTTTEDGLDLCPRCSYTPLPAT